MAKFSVTAKQVRQYLVTFTVEAQDQTEALKKAEEGDYEDVEQDNYDYTLNTDWEHADVERIEEEMQAKIGGEKNAEEK